MLSTKDWTFQNSTPISASFSAFQFPFQIVFALQVQLWKLQLNLKKNRQKNSALGCPKSGSRLFVRNSLAPIFSSDFGQLGFCFIKSISAPKRPIKIC